MLSTYPKFQTVHKPIYTYYPMVAVYHSRRIGEERITSVDKGMIVLMGCYKALLPDSLCHSVAEVP